MNVDMSVKKFMYVKKIMFGMLLHVFAKNRKYLWMIPLVVLMIL